MLKEERQRIILNEVEVHNRVLLSDLAEQLEVSVDTVRRDVKELDRAQKLRKVHGGAVSLGFVSPAAANSNTYALQEKKVIAEKALGLLRDGSVIFMDGGTTCQELARVLPERLDLTCFTISLPVALLLVSKPGVRVVLIGGEVSGEAQITTGASAVRALSEIQVDYGFIGTGYVDALHGLTEFDWDVVQVKKAVIAASRRVVLLCISEKLNSQHRYRTCDINAINTMVTELDPDHNRLNSFRDHQIHIL
ncbi:MAG: DeoR/GlpR family DNA-binding transcription regulator [Robiginitalea sp.]|nr:DeoR/GlpR family DNA-binding transcription regulator [Robiginitalea sp.]